MKTDEVLPRFELGSLDSESRVLTITPQGRSEGRVINSNVNLERPNEYVNGIRTQIRHGIFLLCSDLAPSDMGIPFC